MRAPSLSLGLAVVVGIIAAVANDVPLAAQPAHSASLRIVVIEGEAAVNVIQQKTAIAPVIEVRDRNDQPVAGAVVCFAIRNGRATFSGARSLTVATDAAGRAVATGLTPTGSGALQIGASAAFQGHTAVATIVQTNVMSVTEAAAALGAAGGGAGGAGSGGAAGGAGGAGSGGAAGEAAGGGVSATTVGIVGGAVAGGAIAAKEILRGGDNPVAYRGAYAGQITNVFPGPLACTVTVTHAGTVRVELQVASDGAVTGIGDVQGTMTVTAVSPSGCTAALAQLNQPQMHGCCNPDSPVGGTTGSLTFSGSHPGGAGTTWTYDFTGALSGTTIAGTFTLTVLDPALGVRAAPFPVMLSKN